MPTPKCKDFRGLYDNYLGEDNQTTQAQLQDYHDNQNQLMKEACTTFWQPLTSYPIGYVIRSSNMPAGTWAIVVREGTSGEEEPTWDYASQSVSDGSVLWMMFLFKVTVNGIEANGDGDIVISKADVDLDKVDNTPDIEKVVAQAGKVGNKTVGGTAQPVYIKDGVPEGLTSNIGGNAQPIYMLSGVLKALGVTIGSSSKPVYLDAGVIKECATALGASANGGIVAQSLGTNGYVKFSNGLILQWGYVSSYDGFLTVTFPITYTSTGFTVVCCAVSGGSTGNAWGQLARGSVTKTSFGTNLDGEGVSWLSFGK